MHGVAVYSANMAKQPRSKASLHSRAARERGRTFFRGVANNTPCYGCCTLSGLPSESKARSFSQKLNVVHASLREWGLLSASFRVVYKTTRKEYGILQTRHTDVCLDKADGVCRREVGTARLPAVTLPCLDCLIIHIHSYLYCYPYYFISILLHYHIDVLTYCYIVSFLHYRISA